ncbi:MAG: alpha/beta hydrolase, partial [Lactobacillus amylovorus]|nr:alpha/beta hydrolase [Lactobacillus amylovorus]
WVVPGAAHAKSYATHPRGYRRHLTKFLDHYIK